SDQAFAAVLAGWSRIGPMAAPRRAGTQRRRLMIFGSAGHSSVLTGRLASTTFRPVPPEGAFTTAPTLVVLVRGSRATPLVDPGARTSRRVAGGCDTGRPRARRCRRSVHIVVRVLADGPRRGAVLRIWAVDVAAGAVLATIFVAVSGHIPPASDQRHLDALGYALLVSAGAAVALWRRWPQGGGGVAVAVLRVGIWR